MMYSANNSSVVIHKLKLNYLINKVQCNVQKYAFKLRIKYIQDVSSWINIL